MSGFRVAEKANMETYHQNHQCSDTQINYLLLWDLSSSSILVLSSNQMSCKNEDEVLSFYFLCYYKMFQIYKAFTYLGPIVAC